jgi:hypothetical protein
LNFAELLTVKSSKTPVPLKVPEPVPLNPPLKLPPKLAPLPPTFPD